MSWNPDEFTEYSYSEYSSAPDYADPAYYRRGELHAPPIAPYWQQQANEPAVLDDDSSGVEEEVQDEVNEDGTVKKGKKGKQLAGLGGIGATIAGLLVKFKTLLLVLFDLKWLVAFSKIGFTSITVLISIGAYSLIFGWQFAIGLVALLFVHEMGHAIVMKLKGIPIGGMIFIPLLGAAVFMRQMPKNARDEAEVGIAGPIAGAIAASVCLFFAQVYPDTIWAPLAYFGFFINLFNLIPIVPFDGGRVLAAIDRRLWILGFLGLVAYLIWYYFQYQSLNIWLLFFIFMAATQLWSRRATPDNPEAQAYYSVPVNERIILTLAYFGLAAVLVLGMSISHAMIHTVL